MKLKFRNFPKYKYIFSIILISGSVFIFNCCTTEPDSVGRGIIPPSDLVRLDTITIDAISSSTELKAFINPYSTRFLIGKCKDFEAYGLLQFVGIPDSMKYWTISEALVQLNGEYVFGSLPSTDLEIRVRKILKSWSGDYIPFDTVAASSFSSQYFWLGTLKNTTDSGSFSFTINPQWITDWATPGNDSSNFGVLIQPDLLLNPGMNTVRGFRTFDNSSTSLIPSLRIIYKKTGSLPNDTLVIQQGIGRYSSRLTDTTFVTNRNYSIIRNGVVYHPLIQFNSQIQKLRGAVHKAILEITVLDSISETNSYSDNKIYSQFVSASGNEGYSIGSDKTTIGNKTTYKFLITEYVKQWFISTESRRISLYASNEAISADKFVICGANWFETNYRPKITVTFSKSQ